MCDSTSSSFLHPAVSCPLLTETLEMVLRSLCFLCMYGISAHSAAALSCVIVVASLNCSGLQLLAIFSYSFLRGPQEILSLSFMCICYCEVLGNNEIYCSSTEIVTILY